MLDARTVDNLRFLLEEAVRDYSRANSENKRLMLLIGQTMLESTDDLSNRMDQYREQYSDNENTMTVAKDQFEFTKRKLLDLVNSLTMPE